MPETPSPAPGAIQIEVAYALPDRQCLCALTVPPGTTAQDAVERSGLLQRYPELDPQQLKLGVFGKAIAGDTPLRDRDRVEIYRPLLGDPKEIRRRRAAEGKAMRKGQRAEGANGG